MTTLSERVAALAAAGQLTDAQQARAVSLGLLPAATAAPAAQTSATNRAALLTKARTAQTTNATYLALASPTTAQNTAQIRALTRQVNALIKLATADLADTTGT